MLDEALIYFNKERLFAEDFLNADKNNQEKALKMATNQISILNISEKYKIEEDYKKAIFEQALYLLQTVNSNRSKLIAQGVNSFSVEGLSESYNTNISRNALYSNICSDAMKYLKKYLKGSFEIC